MNIQETLKKLCNMITFKQFLGLYNVFNQGHKISHADSHLRYVSASMHVITKKFPHLQFWMHQ